MAKPFITELHVSAGAEDELYEHKLTADDALEVLWNGPEFFRDKVGGRYRMIGKDDGGRILTIIVEQTKVPGRWDTVTGWKAGRGDETLWRKSRS